MVCGDGFTASVDNYGGICRVCRDPVYDSLDRSWFGSLARLAFKLAGWLYERAWHRAVKRLRGQR